MSNGRSVEKLNYKKDNSTECSVGNKSDFSTLRQQATAIPKNRDLCKVCTFN